MHDDPAVTKAAIEALRRELRSRTGGKMAPPPGPPGAHDGGGGPPPPEGSPEEEAHESPADEQSEGGEMLTCPHCGAQFTEEEAEGDKGDEPAPSPDHGAPPEHGEDGDKGLLLLMPKGGKK